MFDAKMLVKHSQLFVIKFLLKLVFFQTLLVRTAGVVRKFKISINEVSNYVLRVMLMNSKLVQRRRKGLKNFLSRLIFPRYEQRISINDSTNVTIEILISERGSCMISPIFTLFNFILCLYLFHYVSYDE